MNQVEVFPGTAVDWNKCVDSTLAFEADTSLLEIYNSLLERDECDRYAAIVQHDRPIGLISLAQIGNLFNSRYGHVLYGRKPAREYMTKSIFRICDAMDPMQALRKALTRPVPYFYDNVMYVKEDGAFIGMISLRTLVQVQAFFLNRLEEKMNGQADF
jgi:hypothetical protein